MGTWVYPKNCDNVHLNTLLQEIRAVYDETQVVGVSCELRATPNLVLLTINGDNLPDNQASRDALDIIINAHDGLLAAKKEFVKQVCATRSAKLEGTGLVSDYDLRSTQVPPLTTTITLNGTPETMTADHRNDIELYSSSLREMLRTYTNTKYNAHSLEDWQAKLASNEAPWPVAPATVLGLGIF